MADPIQTPRKWEYYPNPTSTERKWEYYTVSILHRQHAGQSLNSLDDYFNELGAHGWELVCFLPGFGYENCALFKREKRA